MKPGEYKVTVTDNKAVIATGKKSVEANVKVETGDAKFNSTTVRYQTAEAESATAILRSSVVSLPIVTLVLWWLRAS